MTIIIIVYIAQINKKISVKCAVHDKELKLIKISIYTI